MYQPAVITINLISSGSREDKCGGFWRRRTACSMCCAGLHALRTRQAPRRPVFGGECAGRASLARVLAGAGFERARQTVPQGGVAKAGNTGDLHQLHARLGDCSGGRWASDLSQIS